jgi:hypothetical protein
MTHLRLKLLEAGSAHIIIVTLQEIGVEGLEWS